MEDIRLKSVKSTPAVKTGPDYGVTRIENLSGWQYGSCVENDRTMARNRAKITSFFSSQTGRVTSRLMSPDRPLGYRLEAGVEVG